MAANMPRAIEELRWFHVILTTYGVWLPGDPRGFRTRDHRDHVEGDYKHPPPPGEYERLHDWARAQQIAPTVTFTPPQRRVVLRAIHEKLTQLDCLSAILAVGGRHAHLLIKMTPSLTRHQIGMVKRHVTFTLRHVGRNGPVWAGGAKFVPIRDRGHQLNAYKYIADHVHEGAVVWRHREAPPAVDPGDAVAGL